MIFFPPKKKIRFSFPRVRGMSDDAGRNAWLANMAALGAGGGSSGERAQTTDHPGMATIANLQPLSATASASATNIPTVDEPSKSPVPRGVGLSISPLMLKQMEDEVVEGAQTLGREQYTENCPSGNVLQRAARKTATVWINLTEEFEKVLKNCRAVVLTFKWNVFPEVKQYLKDEMLPPRIC